MKTLALLLGAALADTPQRGSKACVTNQAAFVLYWWYEDLNLSGAKSSETDNYPVGQTECMDVNIEGATPGNYIDIYVHAVLGRTQYADTPMIYDPTYPPLTYICKGTTLMFNCDLAGYDEEQDLL